MSRNSKGLAIKAFERSLELIDRYGSAYSDRHQRNLKRELPLMNLAHLYCACHNYKRSEALYKELLEMPETKESASYLEVLEGYSLLLRNTNRASTAKEFEVRAEEVKTKRDGA